MMDDWDKSQLLNQSNWKAYCLEQALILARLGVLPYSEIIPLAKEMMKFIEVHLKSS